MGLIMNRSDQNCSDDYIKWTEEELIRKADQESEMGSLAASDGDGADAARHFRLEKLYRTELNEHKGVNWNMRLPPSIGW